MPSHLAEVVPGLLFATTRYLFVTSKVDSFFLALEREDLVVNLPCRF